MGPMFTFGGGDIGDVTLCILVGDVDIMFGDGELTLDDGDKSPGDVDNRPDVFETEF